MTPLCFIDTETDGVHPKRLAWDVAMIRRDDEGQREISFFVDIDLAKSDPFGLKVGRFYERHPRGMFYAGALDHDPECDFDHIGDEKHSGRMVYEPVAAQIIARWTHGAHLVGAVPDFDARTLDAMLRRHGFLPAWHYHLIDVEAMAAGWLHGHAAGRTAATEGEVQGIAPSVATPPWRSDDLGRACGVEPPDDAERHTALGDARWAMRWYDAMTGDPDA